MWGWVRGGSRPSRARWAPSQLQARRPPRCGPHPQPAARAPIHALVATAGIGGGRGRPPSRRSRAERTLHGPGPRPPAGLAGRARAWGPARIDPPPSAPAAAPGPPHRASARHPPRSPPTAAVSCVNLSRRAADAPLACPPADACVAESMPTISGGSNLDCVDMVVLPGGGAGSCGAPAADADAGADAVEALAAEAHAAASDNESVDDGADDVPAPKFRKLICSEPPPAVRVSCRQLPPAAGCWEVVRDPSSAGAGLACLVAPAAPAPARPS